MLLFVAVIPKKKKKILSTDVLSGGSFKAEWKLFTNYVYFFLN